MGKEETNAYLFFFFFSSPPPASQLDIVTFYFLYKTGFFFFSLVYRTVQASNCQLAVTWKEVSCIVEAKQESRRINSNNSASDSLEWTVRTQPDEKTLLIFFFFSDSEITQLLFVTNTCSVTLSGWYLHSPMQLETWNWSCLNNQSFELFMWIMPANVKVCICSQPGSQQHCLSVKAFYVQYSPEELFLSLLLSVNIARSRIHFNSK